MTTPNAPAIAKCIQVPRYIDQQNSPKVINNASNVKKRCVSTFNATSTARAKSLKIVVIFIAPRIIEPLAELRASSLQFQRLKPHRCVDALQFFLKRLRQ